MKKELRLALRYIKRYWWRYVLGIAALFLVDQLIAEVPKLSGELTDGLAQSRLNMQGVWGIAWRLLGMGALVTLGRFGWRFFLFGAARLVEKDLVKD